MKEAPKPWQTVRDAIGDLPDPQSKAALKIANHEFRPGARSYAGHTGSVLDEPSKTIKAGAHGVPGGENTVVLDDGSVRYYTVRESARISNFPVTIFSRILDRKYASNRKRRSSKTRADDWRVCYQGT